MVSELKNKIDELLSQNESVIRDCDPLIRFILKDHIKNYKFCSGLRILPFEVVEKYGAEIIQFVNKYQKYFDPSYDIFLVEWEKHLEDYWKDKLLLLEEYLKPVSENKSPLQTFNHLNNWMIKIEKRSILLTPDPTKIVEQKHTRASGAEKDYLFIRSNWIDEDGIKKRMIARHIGDKYHRMGKEIMDLFLDRGFGVIPNFKSTSGKIYDLVIQRGDMKSIVEIKIINENSFTNLFLFCELLKKFETEYPEG